jgi:hypothetical protein
LIGQTYLHHETVSREAARETWKDAADAASGRPPQVNGIASRAMRRTCATGAKIAAVTLGYPQNKNDGR